MPIKVKFHQTRVPLPSLEAGELEVSALPCRHHVHDNVGAPGFVVLEGKGFAEFISLADGSGSIHRWPDIDGLNK